MGESRSSTFSGVLWSLVERFSSQAIGFVVILVMARLLTPSDYGLVGMLTIFIEVGSSLTDSGFSQALIRSRTRSRRETSTVFWFNIAAGGFLYLLIWVSAPHIAHYYGQPQLEPLARALGILIPVNALTVVQRALLSKALNFRLQARGAVIAYLLSGGVGIYLAYSGFGVWSIAIYQLTSQTLYSVMLWIFGRWHPSLTFSLRSFKSMFGFGSRLAVAGLMDIVYRNVYLLVIGKVYRAADLGYFTRAQQIGGFLSANLSGVIQRVSYPVLCNYQEDRNGLRESFMKMSRTSIFCIFPMMWMLVALPEPVVYLLLGPRWSFSAVLLPPLALSFMWHPVQSMNLQVMQVCGRSDLFLKVEFVKKFFGILILLITVPLGLEAICWGMVAGTVVSYVCNAWYGDCLCGAGILSQLRVYLPIFSAGGFAAAAARWGATMAEGEWNRLVVGLLCGGAVYSIWALATKAPEPRYIIRAVRSLTGKR